jgi:hypothetical protein
VNTLYCLEEWRGEKSGNTDVEKAEHFEYVPTYTLTYFHLKSKTTKKKELRRQATSFIIKMAKMYTGVGCVPSLMAVHSG